MILSYFHNIMHLLSQMTDTEMQRLALTESAKLVPYITNSRKSVKAYLKVCSLIRANSPIELGLTPEARHA